MTKQLLFIDEVTLSHGHNLIMGNTPEVLRKRDIPDGLKFEASDLESFGLFDSSTPNYATYYPDVTAEDLVPKEGEFIYPVFRMLSEVSVNKQSRPVSFAKPGVLKKSMNLLLGQTVNIDHETALGNAIGAVKKVFWQEAYTTPDGKKIPAGINAVLAIDGKSNPRIARGIMMDPPSIHSNSVTVRFKWEKSHPHLDDTKFSELLGTTDVEGKLVQRVASEIMAYFETSLVGHGADPFAQRVKEDGTIQNPGFATRMDSFSSNTNNKNTYLYDFKYDDTLDMSFQADTTTLFNNNNNQNQTPMKKHLLAFAVTLGFAATAGQEEMEETSFADFINSKLTADKTQLENLTALATEKDSTITSLTSDLEKLKTEVSSLQDSELTALRTETVKSFRLLNTEAPETDPMITLINKASKEEITVLKEKYTSEVNLKFPLTCNHCQSTDVSRASAKPDDNQTSQNSLETVEEILRKKAYTKA
jgi:hypothetical protein